MLHWSSYLVSRRSFFLRESLRTCSLLPALKTLCSWINRFDKLGQYLECTVHHLISFPDRNNRAGPGNSEVVGGGGNSQDLISNIGGWLTDWLLDWLTDWLACWSIGAEAAKCWSLSGADRKPSAIRQHCVILLQMTEVYPYYHYWQIVKMWFEYIILYVVILLAVDPVCVDKIVCTSIIINSVCCWIPDIKNQEW